MRDLHLGRSWSGHPLEDACPCPKAPCGLVDATQITDESECEQHSLHYPRTMRQAHSAENCPGKEA